MISLATTTAATVSRFRIRCGRCNKSEQIAENDPRNYVSAARGRGWVDTSAYGWVCATCNQLDVEGRQRD
jgi:hypothetical protein